jgi:hypothetical protein
VGGRRRRGGGVFMEADHGCERATKRRALGARK